MDAKDGDDLALFGKKPPNPNEKQGRGTHMNIINYYNSGGSMGEKPEGWTEQDVQNYIDKFVSSKPKALSASGSRSSPVAPLKKCTSSPKFISRA